MSYIETKKKLDAIRQKYGCKGEVLFRTAIQYIVDYGRESFNEDNWFEFQMKAIDERHDKIEAEGKIYIISREFDKAILECAKELAQVEAYNFLTYIGREVWLGGGAVGEPDYQRAMEIIRNCLSYIDNEGGYYTDSPSITLRKFREMDLEDDEIAYFGYEYLFDVEDEEEE